MKRLISTAVFASAARTGVLSSTVFGRVCSGRSRAGNIAWTRKVSSTARRLPTIKSCTSACARSSELRAINGTKEVVMRKMPAAALPRARAKNSRKMSSANTRAKFAGLSIKMPAMRRLKIQPTAINTTKATAYFTSRDRRPDKSWTASKEGRNGNSQPNKCPSVNPIEAAREILNATLCCSKLPLANELCLTDISEDGDQPNPERADRVQNCVARCVNNNVGLGTQSHSRQIIFLIEIDPDWETLRRTCQSSWRIDFR